MTREEALELAKVVLSGRSTGYPPDAVRLSKHVQSLDASLVSAETMIGRLRAFVELVRWDGCIPTAQGRYQPKTRDVCIACGKLEEFHVDTDCLISLLVWELDKDFPEKKEEKET